MPGVQVLIFVAEAQMFLAVWAEQPSHGVLLIYCIPQASLSNFPLRIRFSTARETKRSQCRTLTMTSHLHETFRKSHLMRSIDRKIKQLKLLTELFRIQLLGISVCLRR